MSERDPTDFYETPPPVARMMAAELAEAMAGRARVRVLDPGAGRGTLTIAIGEALTDRRIRFDLTAVELPENRERFDQPLHTALQHVEQYADNGSTTRIEWEDLMWWTPPEPFDVVICNPPFSIAEDFIRRIAGSLSEPVPQAELGVPPIGVTAVAAFLTRLSFLGSDTRYPFHREHAPLGARVIVPRPSFTGDGNTDPGGEVEWLIYGEGVPWEPFLDWHKWR